MKNLTEVSEGLNKKYAKIPDFITYVDGDRVMGGFYKQCFFDRICGNGWMEYYFHETFGRLSKEVGSYDELFNYLDSCIQSQLKRQKDIDEAFAKEKGIKVDYMYNYSKLIAS
jgi:hypothetical protein